MSSHSHLYLIPHQFQNRVPSIATSFCVIYKICMVPVFANMSPSFYTSNLIYLNISFPWQNLVMYFKTTCSWCALISINFIFLNLIYFYNTILIPTPIPPGTKPQTESNCKSLKSDNRCRYYCFYDSLSPTLTPQSPTRRTFCRLNCSQKSFLSQPSYNHNLLIAEIICLFYLGFVRVFTPQRVRYLFI